MKALMLQQPNPITMQQVLSDLSRHPDYWDAFVTGPRWPTTEQVADPGTLVCLRDLFIGWNTDTLYVLAPTAQRARSLKTLAKGWNCTEVMIHSAESVQHLVGKYLLRGQSLVSAYWQCPALVHEEFDFDTTYDLAEPVQFDGLPELGKCSPQVLMAGLLLKHGSEKFHAPTILKDLQSHPQWWYSFIAGPALPNSTTGIANRLSGLRGFPDYWWTDCLYLWSRSQDAAIQLKALGQNWSCKTATILDSQETARLLALPKSPPVVVLSWR